MKTPSKSKPRAASEKAQENALVVIEEPKPSEKKEREFEDGPWAQKFMHGVDKKAAYLAAKRARKTVPEWLAEAIQEKVFREREDITDDKATGGSALVTIDGPDVPGMRVLAPIDITADEILRTVEVAEKIRQKRGKGEFPPNARILVDAERRLRAKVA